MYKCVHVYTCLYMCIYLYIVYCTYVYNAYCISPDRHPLAARLLLLLTLLKASFTAAVRLSCSQETRSSGGVPSSPSPSSPPCIEGAPAPAAAAAAAAAADDDKAAARGRDVMGMAPAFTSTCLSSLGGGTTDLVISTRTPCSRGAVSARLAKHATHDK